MLSPVCELPVLAKQKNAKIFIIYSHKFFLQYFPILFYFFNRSFLRTPLDTIADVVYQHSKMDVAMRQLMTALSLDVPQYILSKSLTIGYESEELPQADKAAFKKGNMFVPSLHC